MKITKQIRISWGRFLLNRKAKKLQRNKVVHNLNSAKSIALVYKYRTEEEFKLVENFVTEIRERRIEIKALVYLPYLKLLEYIPQKLSIDYFTDNDLNAFYHPVSQRANEFMETQYDLFIDLNTTDFFPLECVITLSKALFKVRAFEGGKLDVYDMMLKISPEEDLKNIINQAVHYLNMLTPA